MVIGDGLPTDKPTYEQRFGEPFETTRQQTLDWLKTQELVAMPFYAGPDALGYGSPLLLAPQAAVFAPPSATRSAPAASLSSTTAPPRTRKSSPTTSIPAPAPKKASTPCCSTSAN